MQKVKEFLRSKTMRMSMTLCMVAAVLAVSCFAENEPSAAATITSSFTTGFQQIVSDSTTMLAAIVPVALGLAGLIFLVRKAMGWFKSMAK